MRALFHQGPALSEEMLVAGMVSTQGMFPRCSEADPDHVRRLIFGEPMAMERVNGRLFLGI